MKTRFKESKSHIKYNRSDKLAIANQRLTTSPTISNSSFKTLKQIIKQYYFIFWGTYYIYQMKEKLLNNEDIPIVNSPLGLLGSS